MSAPLAAPAPPVAEEPGRSQLPLREALSFFVFQSLKLRMGRMAVVLLGIIFAIAFLAVLLGTEIVFAGIHRLSAKAGNTVEASSGFQRWWIAVALLIATVGVTNAVLMSVTERIKEIGTLKCLGARSLHIMQIFLFETLLLGGIGGLGGGLLGVLGVVAMFAMPLKSDFGLVFSWLDALWLVGLSTAASLGISLVAAVAPLIYAARIEPAEAMRYEV